MWKNKAENIKLISLSVIHDHLSL